VLRIQRDQVSDHEVTLLLQGRIVSDWVVVLERECEEAHRSGLRVALDFSDVKFIDRSGFAALSRLASAGVAIVGHSPLVAAMLEQEGIEAHAGGTEPPGGGANPRTLRRESASGGSVPPSTRKVPFKPGLGPDNKKGDLS